MARVPNEKAAKAEAMYHDGMKLVDIARKLDVPPGPKMEKYIPLGWKF